MASTNFVDYSNATPITAAWLNDVNRTQYTILGNPADRTGLVALDTATATGTSDALVGAFSVALSSLPDGIVYRVQATAANTTTTPTFTPNSGVISPATIVKGNGTPLVVGDIAGANHWLTLQWNATLAKWVLVNPVYGVSLQEKQLQPIVASVASNALTLTLNPTFLEFRSNTLTTGTANTRQVVSAVSVVVPSGATLGTINATQARLVLLAIDNAGTVELAVVNLAGGNNLDETTLISTTAISASATANKVIYSTTARTNVPFRVVGFVDITEATAGTWATAPTLVQGQGGQALAAMSSLGMGQTWQDVTGSRVIGTTYYNLTGRPIEVNLSQYVSTNTGAEFYINGVSHGYICAQTGATGVGSQVSLTIPHGANYSAQGTGSISHWFELR